MLDTARAKAPELEWHLADLLDIDLARTFDLVALPGNVMIFLSPGTEADVVANMARTSPRTADWSPVSSSARPLPARRLRRRCRCGRTRTRTSMVDMESCAVRR